MNKRAIIATLIKAGRPDLANHVAYVSGKTTTYWQQKYGKISDELNRFADDFDIWARNVKNSVGTKDPAYKGFVDAAKATRALIKDLVFLKSFSARQLVPERPREPARPITPPPEVQRIIDRLNALPKHEQKPAEKSALQKLLEQFKKLRHKPTPEEQWEKFHKQAQKALKKAAKRSGTRVFRRQASVEAAYRMDRDHAYALVCEALRTELPEPVSRRDLISWFSGTAWADIYQSRMFARAVDDLIRSGGMRRVGTKLLLVG